MGHHVDGEVAIGAGGGGDRPSLWSGDRTGASSNSRIGAAKGQFGKTGAAVVRLGQLKGSCHVHFVESLRSDDLLYHLPRRRRLTKRRGGVLGSSLLTRMPHRIL